MKFVGGCIVMGKIEPLGNVILFFFFLLPLKNKAEFGWRARAFWESSEGFDGRGIVLKGRLWKIERAFAH